MIANAGKTAEKLYKITVDESLAAYPEGEFPKFAPAGAFVIPKTLERAYAVRTKDGTFIPQAAERFLHPSDTAVYAGDPVRYYFVMPAEDATVSQY